MTSHLQLEPVLFCHTMLNRHLHQLRQLQLGPQQFHPRGNLTVTLKVAFVFGHKIQLTVSTGPGIADEHHQQTLGQPLITLLKQVQSRQELILFMSNTQWLKCLSCWIMLYQFLTQDCKCRFQLTC